MTKMGFLRAGLLGLGASLALNFVAPIAKANAAEPSVGIVNLDSSSLTANAVAVAVYDALKKIGSDVLIQDSKGDAAQANTICTQYVTRKVQAIVVMILDAPQMAQCLAYAKAGSIPVFFIGPTYKPGMAGSIDTIVATPINEAFMKYAEKIKDLNIFELTFHPGAPCLVREQNIDALIKKSGIAMNVEKHEIVIPGQVTNALAATQAWLNAHPADQHQNLAIWACFSDPAFGALSAIRQASRKGIGIYTWDFTKQVVEPIESGEMAATLAYDAPGIGQQMIKMIKDELAGGQPHGEEANAFVITGENIKSFMKDHPEALP
jgi:ribose transport system substrate-binding protein